MKVLGGENLGRRRVKQHLHLHIPFRYRITLIRPMKLTYQPMKPQARQLFRAMSLVIAQRSFRMCSYAMGERSLKHMDGKCSKEDDVQHYDNFTAR